MNKRGLFITFAGFTALLCTDAFASTDSFVELQVGAGRLAEIVRRQLTGTSEICPQSFFCPFAPQEICYVDHVEVSSPGSWSRESTFSSVAINSFTSLPAMRILLHQPVVAYVKTNACVDDPACSAALPYPLAVTYALYSNADGELCLESHGNSELPPGLNIPDTSYCMGLNIEHVLAISGQTSGTVSGAAVTLSSDGSRIATRIELGRVEADYDAARINAWQSFLLGNIESTGAAGDWSMFTHQSLIRAALEQRIAAAIAPVTAVQIDGGITSSWNGLGPGGGAALVQFDAIVDHECTISISDVTFSVVTGMNATQDGLTSLGSIGWNLSDDQLLACAMQLAGPFGLVLLPAIESALDVDLSGLVTGCQPTGHNTFVCEQKTHPLIRSLGPGQSAVFELAEVIGSNAGLAMNGPLELAGAAVATTTVQTFAPSLGLTGKCHGQKTCDYTGGLSIYGTARICSVTFWNDLQGVFLIHAPEDWTLPAHFTVTVNPSLTDTQKALYESQGQPLLATVATTAGIKTYAFPISDLLPSFEQELQCGAMNIDAWIECLEPGELPWETYPELWEPDWSIDAFELPFEVLDASRLHLDYGVGEHLTLSVTRGRGNVVLSATLGLTAHAGVGGGQVITQNLSLALSVPPGTVAASNVELMRRILPGGYHQIVALDPRLVPPSAAGATIDLEISLAQLEAAAGR